MPKVYASRNVQQEVYGYEYDAANTDSRIARARSSPDKRRVVWIHFIGIPPFGQGLISFFCCDSMGSKLTFRKLSFRKLTKIIHRDRDSVNRYGIFFGIFFFSAVNRKVALSTP